MNCIGIALPSTQNKIEITNQKNKIPPSHTSYKGSFSTDTISSVAITAIETVDKACGIFKHSYSEFLDLPILEKTICVSDYVRDTYLNSTSEKKYKFHDFKLLITADISYQDKKRVLLTTLELFSLNKATNLVTQFKTVLKQFEKETKPTAHPAEYILYKRELTELYYKENNIKRGNTNSLELIDYSIEHRTEFESVFIPILDNFLNRIAKYIKTNEPLPTFRNWVVALSNNQDDQVRAAIAIVLKK